ncbi:hypothetical protein C500_06796 [Natrialba magadii ATCC 43099]|uniref:Uncharacterized protein n=1 Tax=Natrialba magadii (strain ATCC 43099 / DSM 3394 / CCM 3739 / CIP 104546 / IAM 13178 / JCM 8861 / NBRC 102185 / NCIMB 2190 / MS3) TaxID=547559 RepID=L9V2K5_NATMM|nr:hypothetical protein C500_06796 [Natrialba magadii ATCC 43099]
MDGWAGTDERLGDELTNGWADELTNGRTDRERNQWLVQKEPTRQRALLLGNEANPGHNGVPS